MLSANFIVLFLVCAVEAQPPPTPNEIANASRWATEVIDKLGGGESTTGLKTLNSAMVVGADGGQPQRYEEVLQTVLNAYHTNRWVIPEDHIDMVNAMDKAKINISYKDIYISAENFLQKHNDALNQLARGGHEEAKAVVATKGSRTTISLALYGNLKDEIKWPTGGSGGSSSSAPASGASVTRSGKKYSKD